MNSTTYNIKQLANASPQDLRIILSTERFFAVPESVTIWLKETGLPLSQRLIFERIIAKAIQRPKNRKELRVFFSYNSLAKEVGCSSKTIQNLVNQLIELGLLDMVRAFFTGTVYRINLPNIKLLAYSAPRKPESITVKAPDSAPYPVTEQPEHEPTLSHNAYKETPEQQPEHEPTLSNSAHEDEIKSEIARLEFALKGKQSNLDEINQAWEAATNFGPTSIKTMLKRTFSRNIEAEELETQSINLSGEIDKMRGTITRLTTQLTKLATESQTPNKVSLVNTEQTNNSAPNAPRYIQKSQIKALWTRLKALTINGYELTKQMKADVLNQIVWAIRYGHLNKQGQSTFKLTNLALCIVKDNNWRCPIGYQLSQVQGLTKWALGNGY